MPAVRCSLVASFFALALSTACVTEQAGRAPDRRSGYRQITLTGAQRELISISWDPADSPLAFGLDYNQNYGEEDIGWEIGVHLAEDNGSEQVGLQTFEVDSRTIDGYIGLRHTLIGGDGGWRYYLGAGGTAIFGKLETSDELIRPGGDDWGFGGYAHGGLEWLLGQHFTFGVDARYVFLTNQLSLGAAEPDADFWQVGAALGFVF